jgi:hypothetical protein
MLQSSVGRRVQRRDGRRVRRTLSERRAVRGFDCFLPVTLGDRSATTGMMFATPQTAYPVFTSDGELVLVRLRPFRKLSLRM